MDIEIKYTDIQELVSNHLDVLGKRLKDKDGNTLWTTITASSAEMVIINDYIKTAVHKVVAELRKMVEYAVAITDEEGIMFTIRNPRDPMMEEKEGLSGLFHDIVVRFCQSYALAEFLNMVAPETARKYEAEEMGILKDLKQLFEYRKAPRMLEHPYTSTIGDLPSHVTMIVGDDMPITYTTDYGKVDDISAFSTDEKVVMVHPSREGHQLKARAKGTAKVVLYSIHNTDVRKTFEVIVNEEE